MGTWMPVRERGLTSVIKILDLIHRRFIVDSFPPKGKRFFVKLDRTHEVESIGFVTDRDWDSKSCHKTGNKRQDKYPSKPLSSSLYLLLAGDTSLK